MPSDQSKIIEQPKFTYFPLGKAFKKQTKAIEDQGEKQIKAFEKHGKQLNLPVKRILNNFKTKDNFWKTC